MFNDPAPLLLRPRKKAGNIDECNYRYVKTIAESDEPGRFPRGVDIQDPSEHLRLIAHDSDRPAAQPGKPDDDILPKVPLNFQKLPLIHHAVDDLLYIVGLGRLIGDQLIQEFIPPSWTIGVLNPRRLGAVVLGNVGEKLPHPLEAGYVVLLHKVGHSAPLRMDEGPAELLVGHLLLGDRLDHLRASDIHVACPLDHEDEIGDRRRVYRSPGTGPHDY